MLFLAPKLPKEQHILEWANYYSIYHPRYIRPVCKDTTGTDLSYYNTLKHHDHRVMCRLDQCDVTNHPAEQIVVVANDVTYFMDDETIQFKHRSN